MNRLRLVNQRIRRLLTAVATATMSVLSNPASATAQLLRPDAGTLTYYGGSHAAVDMIWYDIGGFKTPEAGFELDIDLERAYYSACTTWNNLPEGYDDCPTAGVLENDPYRNSLGFGSFNARAIRLNTWYFGDWYFESPGLASSNYGNFSLRWQQTYFRSCRYKDIWCYYTNEEGYLVNSFFRSGETYSWSW